MRAASVVYDSLFLKADVRPTFEGPGSRLRRSLAGPRACLDDIYLAPGATLAPPPTGVAGPLLLLPIAGGVLLSGAGQAEMPLRPGRLYLVPEAAAATLTLTNPFADEAANLLLVQAPVPGAAGAEVRELTVPLTAKNTLVPPDGPALPLWVGLYDSRTKARLPLPAPADCALCYVLNGAFEIEDRLVEHRDALVLWNTAAIDFEALAETSMLLCLQVAGGRTGLTPQASDRLPSERCLPESPAFDRSDAPGV